MDENVRDQLVWLMSKLMKMNTAFCSKSGPAMNEMAILNIISGKCSCCGQGGTNLNMRDIQERLQISRPMISYTLNSLEKKAYIVREIDARDRRRISVQITPEGTAVSELFMRRYDETWNRIMEEFGEENMMQLIALLTRFSDVLDSL